MVAVRGRQWSGMVGRGMIRSFGQVAVSVIATLIATQIYSAMRHVEHAPDQRTASVTTGGKYDARIAGAELPPLPESTKPALSIVNWSITPLNPLRPVNDPGWGGLDHEAAVAGEPVPARAPRREVRRPGSGGVATVAQAAPASALPSRSADLSRLDPATASATGPSPERGGLVATAAGAVTSVRDLGGSVLAMGISAVDRLLPDRR